ncbi:hypothetical protein RRF57_008064 [Xylaria bambusicola]|uniref:Protein kinase domain-containing protein n=1 Tax=Xylaria bambusicola TaxID=326684 RepID=A0AAN7UH43_9PEZI
MVVMFGGLDQHEKEHRVVPIAKLIDLGEANERPIVSVRLTCDLSRPNIGRRNKGIDKNLLDIGVLMANLISNTRGFVISCQRSIMNPNIHRHLDQDLRLLVQRCLAVNPENRPRLEELIELVGRENSPFFRDENYYRRDIRQGAINPEEMLETDVALYTIVQKYLLDVDTPPSAVI